MHRELAALNPYDEHNQTLQSHAHPQDWKNPRPDKPYHLAILGAGTAGLVAAAGAAGLGARVALIERELMGGDCLNIGCVPSKAIIAAGRAAAAVRDATAFGAKVSKAEFDFSQVMKRMRQLRARISPADSAQRFTDLGVDVYFGDGSFVDGKTIAVADRHGAVQSLNFQRAVIATGARAAAPPIKGLDSVPYLTNKTVFSLTELPRRLGVVGSGPIGSEMAQTMARLGAQVWMFERGERPLPREEPKASALIQRSLETDGVHLMLQHELKSANRNPSGAIQLKAKNHGGETTEVTVDALLVAVGRAPNVEALSLDNVGVQTNRSGVIVNDHLQTTNPRIFAAGDVASQYKFTHAADALARIVVQNSLFAFGPIGRRKASRLIVPWCTYTSPEVAHVGLYQWEAKERGIPFDTYTQELAGVDRAIVDGHDEGFVQVLTKAGGDEIIGANVVAENAGDLIAEITLAMTRGVGLGAVASVIHPYPTQADAFRKLGDQYNRTRLTPFNRRVINFLRRLNVGR